MKRPKQNPGETPKIKTGCGYMYVTDNTDAEYKELFLRLGKTGGCAAALLQALAMTASKALRAGVPKQELIDLWKGIRCHSPMWDGPTQILSCPDAAAKALEQGIKKEAKED